MLRFRNFCLFYYEVSTYLIKTLLFIQHSICFNGRNYDRPSSIKQCRCTRDDFECDVGYSTPLFYGYFCYPDSNATTTEVILQVCQT